MWLNTPVTPSRATIPPTISTGIMTRLLLPSLSTRSTPRPANMAVTWATT